jgi:hypothetical protein
MRSIPVTAGSIRPAAAHALRREDPKAVLSRLWLDVEAARRALARGRAPAIAHTARGLLATLCNVRIRVELEHAAVAFAEGLDERPEAEEWVFFAVAARAVLDQAEKCGAGILRRELEEIDEIYEDAREAVLLLEPEDYKEALAATPPNTRAWWGERARLDEGMREIDLERVLTDIGETEDAKRTTLVPPPPPLPFKSRA